MGIYNSSYFRINKKMLTYVGLWPFDSRRKKIISRLFFASGIIAMAIPPAIALRTYFGKDIDRVLLHVTVLIYCMMVFTKFIASVIMENKLKVLYDDIASNWQMITDRIERDKLIEHSEKGRYLTLYYLIYLIVANVSFFAMPLMPIILDKLKPLNESRPYIFVLDGEFLIDPHENYSKIYVYDLITLTSTVVVIGTVDTIYVACVEHCIGLFAILNFKDTVKTSYYSSSFLFQMGFNLLHFSMMCVLIIVNLHQYFNLIRYIFLMIGMMMHLFYLSWPGQKLIDYSSGLFRDAYCNEWYEGSERSKKLLRILTLRCAEPCMLTAGGLYVMNFENFLSIMKTSVSYITVFASLR